MRQLLRLKYLWRSTREITPWPVHELQFNIGVRRRGWTTVEPLKALLDLKTSLYDTAVIWGCSTAPHNCGVIQRRFSVKMQVVFRKYSDCFRDAQLVTGTIVATRSDLVAQVWISMILRKVFRWAEKCKLIRAICKSFSCLSVASKATKSRDIWWPYYVVMWLWEVL